MPTTFVQRQQMIIVATQLLTGLAAEMEGSDEQNRRTRELFQFSFTGTTKHIDELKRH
ncbi:MAG: hypothetical protein WKG06_43550 [Segetibacter sp.]